MVFIEGRAVCVEDFQPVWVLAIIHRRTTIALAVLKLCRLTPPAILSFRH